jgi:phage tail-like protein
MAIQDLVGNTLLHGTTAQALGYEEIVEAEVLPLRMYDFLIAPIRDRDRIEGDLFVKRFLEGAQTIWSDTQAKIFELKDLFDVNKCPDDLLQYLKNIVGWTKEPHLKRITDALDYDALRRLIAASVAMWKARGPEDTIAGTLAFLTGERVRIWNWFQLRWVLEETEVGEDHQGRDPWILDLPHEGTDENLFNVRIVDSGDLDRELVINMLKIFRPMGERIEVSYLRFLDMFTTEKDNVQWTENPTVASGQLALTDTTAIEATYAASVAALTWSNYAVYWRVKLTTAAVYHFDFYWQDASNYYQIQVDMNNPTAIKLRKVIAGTPTDLVTYDVVLNTTEWLGLRAEVYEGILKVYLDGDLIMAQLDSDLSEGKIGLGHALGGALYCDEIEVYPIPMDSETIGLNPED